MADGAGSGGDRDDGGRSTRASGPDDEIVIGFSNGGGNVADAAQEHAPADSAVVTTNDVLGFAVVELPPEADSSRRAADIDGRDNVAYAEPNETMTTAFTPDDTYYSGQNALKQVNVPAAWEQTLGASDVTIAVCDTGVKYDHEDLAANMDDTVSNHGTDFVDGDGDPYPEDFSDSPESHGTSVAGIAAAATDNGAGVAGISDCSVLSVRVLNADGTGTLDQIADGIQWAADNGADVINLSLGDDLGDNFPSATIDTALQYAHDAGVLCIGAAGNSDKETSTYSPAGQDHCLAVAALNTDEERASPSLWGSNWGEYVDIAAPGTHHDVDSNYQSTYPADPVNGGKADEYWQFNGTSMAAPVVSGVAGLVLSVDGSLSVDDLERILKETATDIGLESTKQGAGQVDADTAVRRAALDTGVTGVVESNGDPVTGVTVELDGWTATTDGAGSFEIAAESGDYDLAVSGPGITDTVESVSVEQTGDLTDVGTISVATTVDLLPSAGQPDGIEAGDTLAVEFDAYNLETLRVDLTGTYAGSDAELTVDGQSASFGEDVQFDGFTGTLSVTVGTAVDTSGTVALDHVASGAGDRTTVPTGPTMVHESLLDVGVIDAATEYGADIVTTLDEHLGGLYRVSETTTSHVASNPDAYAAVVVQRLDPGDGTLIEEFVGTTASADVGVVYLDQWGGEANAVPQYRAVSSGVTSTDQGSLTATVSYDLATAHPILAGFDTDSDVSVHDGASGDHTWFDSGDGYDVLAATRTEDGVAGEGLAVDEDTRTVLAASLGRSTDVPDSAFTAAGDTVLANAVRHVDGTIVEPTVDAAATAGSGEATLIIDGGGVNGVVVADLWTDWTVTAVDAEADFDDTTLSTDGTCAWSWRAPKQSVALSLTLAVPDRYVDGTFVVTVTGTGTDTTDRTTVSIELG